MVIDGVEVHEGVACGSSMATTRVRLPGVEQRMGEDLDGHRGGALAHADQHRAVADDVDVAALDGGRLVVAVVVAVVGDEVGRRRTAGGSGRWPGVCSVSRWRAGLAIGLMVTPP